MTFSKTSKNIRELIFHKIIKLIVKYFLKYLVHMGRKTKAKKKTLLFPEMRVTKKIFTQAAAKNFFYRFSWIF